MVCFLPKNIKKIVEKVLWIAKFAIPLYPLSVFRKVQSSNKMLTMNRNRVVQEARARAAISGSRACR